MSGQPTMWSDDVFGDIENTEEDLEFDDPDIPADELLDSDADEIVEEWKRVFIFPERYTV